MAKSSVIEAKYLSMSADELKAYYANLVETQKRVKESKVDDPKVVEFKEYEKMQYGEPALEIEKKIKLIRRVFRLKEIPFTFEV